MAGTALIRLYEGLDGASWSNNVNWNTTSGTSAQNKANDPCTVGKRWHGVGFMDPCDPFMDDIIGEGPATDYLTKIRGAGQGCFAGRVTSLNLRRNGLKGNLTIPELGDLGNLTYLDLSWNEIGGEIPTQIGRIANVQVVNLAHNSIVGVLPSELGNLNSNGPPDTTGCGIDDPCPAGVQLKMYDLNVGHNSLSGSIPSQLGQLSHLKILDMTNNNLTSSIPVELGGLERLQARVPTAEYPPPRPIDPTCPPSPHASRNVPARNVRIRCFTCGKTSSTALCPPGCLPT